MGSQGTTVANNVEAPAMFDSTTAQADDELSMSDTSSKFDETTALAADSLNMLEAPQTTTLQCPTLQSPTATKNENRFYSDTLLLEKSPAPLSITPTTAEANADADSKNSHQSGYHSAKGRDGASINAEANADATLLTQSVASGPDLLTQSVASHTGANATCVSGSGFKVGRNSCDATTMTAQPGYVETSAKPTIYLIGERLAVIKHVCSFYGIHVGRTAPMLNFGRRTVSDDAVAMLQAIRRESPDLLWIQWHETAREPSSRPNIRTAVEFLSGLCELQIEANHAVLLEGKAKDVPVRDEVFEGSRSLGKILGQYQHQWWCQLGITNEDGNTVCGDHLVYSSPEWPGGTCQCKRQSSLHHATSGECYEQFIVQALCQFGLITQQQVRAPDQSWHNNQKILKTKTGARDFTRDKSSPTTTFTTTTSSKPGQRKTVTFGPESVNNDMDPSRYSHQKVVSAPGV